MEGVGPRSLILLLVASAIGATTPAAAQVYKRTARDGTTYFTNIQPNSSLQRVVLAQPVSYETPRQPAAEYGTYSQEITEAAARYAVPERLIWAVIRAESG